MALLEPPHSERKTQNRLVALFKNKARPNGLGYDCFEEWNQRPDT